MEANSEYGILNKPKPTSQTKSMKQFFTLLFIISATLATYAQKMPLLQERQEIVEQAKKELDALVANPASDFMTKIAEAKVKGEYVFDITIEGKGKILSVFVVSTDADDVNQQNHVKDLVRKIKFNFKLPKDKSYKFQYTFNF
jgi:hypothetical protein